MKDDLFAWEPYAIRGDKVWRNSRTKGETAPAHNGRGSDESAFLRQQKPQTTARMLTGTRLSSRCTLVSIYQEYSQIQSPVHFSGHDPSY